MGGRLPMFPLGSVLFPHQVVPLHVFEPRYRELTLRCLETDRRFGIVLIERGSEVGGGEVRFDVGTVAEIVEAARLPDGRFLLEVIGRERIRIDQWLPDDPHPWATVSPIEDLRPGDNFPDGVRECVEHLRRLLALRVELGDPAPPATAELHPDPEVASWQVCFLARFNPLDALELLRIAVPETRVAVLRDLLDGEIALAEARL